MIVYMDLDEVLVDFIGAACHVHGVTKPELLARWSRGTWGMHGALGITEHEFWTKIHAVGETFWSGLELKPWAEDLLKLVDNTVGDSWYLVTAPSRHPSSYSGKVQWIKGFFGARFDRYVLTKHKHLLSASGTVLIDDKSDTCEKFKQYGGQSILFPAHHNGLWSKADDPMPHVNYWINLYT